MVVVLVEMVVMVVVVVVEVVVEMVVVGVMMTRKNWSQLKKLRQVGESCSCAEALSCNETTPCSTMRWFHCKTCRLFVHVVQ